MGYKNKKRKPFKQEGKIDNDCEQDSDTREDHSTQLIKNGKAIVTREKKLPIPYLDYDGKEKFLTPQSPEFQRVLQKSYRGFVFENSTDYDANFHVQTRKTFDSLRDRGFFQYDIVMAGGKRLSKTFVRRTLVGNFGITYKYLGLRIFAHSWGPSKVSSPVFKEIHELNKTMIKRTNLATKKCDNDIGSSNYNLTLINYMEPATSKNKLHLKDEPTYGMGKISVSWHADSSLQDFSSIGVYHNTFGKKKSEWRVALRLSPEVNGADKTPPLVVPIKDGDSYYLVGDFNHFHQHMVLSGTNCRYSSTHRVAVEKSDTLEYIENKAKESIGIVGKSKNEPFSFDDAFFSSLQSQQDVLNELEFEWIRQYWCQGKQHDELHVDWQRPIRRLEGLWKFLERKTSKIYKKLMSYEDQVHQLSVTDLKGLLKSLNIILLALKERMRLRQQFDERMKDKVYKQLLAGFQPVDRPCFDTDSFMPRNLSQHIEKAVSFKKKVADVQSKLQKAERKNIKRGYSNIPENFEEKKESEKTKFKKRKFQKRRGKN